MNFERLVKPFRDWFYLWCFGLSVKCYLNIQRIKNRTFLACQAKQGTFFSVLFLIFGMLNNFFCVRSTQITHNSRWKKKQSQFHPFSQKEKNERKRKTFICSPFLFSFFYLFIFFLLFFWLLNALFNSSLITQRRQTATNERTNERRHQQNCKSNCVTKQYILRVATPFIVIKYRLCFVCLLVPSFACVRFFFLFPFFCWWNFFFLSSIFAVP